jgi:hypothetical protein
VRNEGGIAETGGRVDVRFLRQLGFRAAMTTNVRFNGMYFNGLFKQVSFAQLLLERVMPPQLENSDLEFDVVAIMTHDLFLDMTGNLDSGLL